MRVAFLPIGLLLFSGDALAQCTQTRPNTSNYGTVRLVPGPGTPQTVLDGIEQGIRAWNDGSCNAGANDFPIFTTSGSGDVNVPVQFISGVGPFCGDVVVGSHDTSREVQPDECSAADAKNSTTAEQVQESGGTPTPPRPTHTAPGAPPGTPILIDLAGNGFALTSLAQGVRFDIDADGHEEQVSWTSRTSEDAFLALDRNGNGWVDDGSELFGNVTSQPPSPAPNGYLALAVFDDNEDGRITAADEVYRELRLWTDANHDARSQASEITTLQTQGVEAIHLVYLESRLRDRHGNELRYWSLVQRTGRRAFVLSVDVFFRVRD